MFECFLFLQLGKILLSVSRGDLAKEKWRVLNCHAYMSKICEKGEEAQYKGLLYTYFELLDHNITFHGDNPYILLNHLNIYIKMENVERPYRVKHLLDIPTYQCEKCEKQFKRKSSLVRH